MSEAERKSHIPDEKLASLTEKKLTELERERQELSDALSRSAKSGAADSLDSSKLERQIDNHEAAAEKLERYREEMIADSDDGDL